MLTIKHVTGSGEALYQGSEVIYHNGMDTAAAEQLQYLDGKEWKSVRSGIAYVMNDAGKTVATYDMNQIAKTALSSIVGTKDGTFSSLAASRVRVAY